MLKTGKRINSKRVYSEEFKRKVVDDFEKGVMSVHQMERHYGINNVTIYNWIYKYSDYNEKNVRIMEMKDSQTAKMKELERKVGELEQAVGRKQVMIDYLEKMIDLAGKEYGIDIKKNSGSQPCNGSGKTARP